MIDEKKEVERLTREIAILQSSENRLRSSIKNLSDQNDKLIEELEQSKAFVIEQREIANNVAGETASLKKILWAKEQSLKDTKKLIDQANSELEKIRLANEVESNRLDAIRMSHVIKEDDLKKREDSLRDRLNRAEELDAKNIRNSAMVMQKSVELEKQQKEIEFLEKVAQDAIETADERMEKLRIAEELFQENKISFFNECEKKKYELEQMRKNK